MNLPAKFENANKDRETVQKGKAFKKGEKAVYISKSSLLGAFSFRNVVVESCGKVKMTLSDAITGEMLGCDFSPAEGFTCRYSNLGDDRKDFIFCGNGTFKIMSDEEAALICTQLAKERKEYDLSQYAKLAEESNTTAYKENILKLRDELLAVEPRGISSTEEQKEIRSRMTI